MMGAFHGRIRISIFRIGMLSYGSDLENKARGVLTLTCA